MSSFVTKLLFFYAQRPESDAFQLLLGAAEASERPASAAPEASDPCAPLLLVVRQGFPPPELLRCRQALEAVGLRPRWLVSNGSQVEALSDVGADVLWRRFELRNLRALRCKGWAAHMEGFPCEPREVEATVNNKGTLENKAGLRPMRRGFLHAT